MNTNKQSGERKTAEIVLHEELEKIRQNKDGIDFWDAKKVMQKLGYKRWPQFLKVINKAKTVCKNSEHSIDKHFLPIKFSRSAGYFLETQCENFHFTRLALYLILANADGRRPYIAKAQTHFLAETYRMQQAEELQLKKKEYEADKLRIEYREELTTTEKAFSKKLKAELGKNAKYGIVRSAGDEVFFGGKNTASMKQKWGIKNGKLADFLSTPVLAGKNFAAQLTIGALQKSPVLGEGDAKNRHKSSSRKVRQMLLEAGMPPEEGKVEEVRIVRRRVKQTEELLAKLTSSSINASTNASSGNAQVGQSEGAELPNVNIAGKALKFTEKKCRLAFANKACTEATLWELAILIMAKNSNYYVTTEVLEQQIPQHYSIPKNAKDISPIKAEPKYIQRIRNLKSNKGNKTSPINKGFVMVANKGFCLSLLGLQEAKRLHIKYF